jgi:hypothetical protein
LAVFFPFLLIFIPLYNATSGVICATETDCGFRKNVSKVFSHLCRRPLHAVCGCGVLFFVMLIIILNLACLSVVIPMLMKVFFNMDTAFSTVTSLDALIALLFNSTIWSIIFGLAWLALEPLYTAYCLLRVFYGESSLKGLDLKAQILRFARKVVIVMVMLLTVSAVFADGGISKPARVDASQSAKQLEKQIEQTLQGSEFQWRDEFIPNTEKSSNWFYEYVSKALKYVWDFCSDILDWLGDKLKNWIPRSKASGGGSSWWVLWDIGKYILIGIAVVIGVFFLISYLRKRAAGKVVTGMVSLQEIPDLTDENISADELEQGAWLQLGSDLLEQGNYRLALRAFYLGCISALADRHLLNIAVGKSDYEYLFELQRRGHSEPQLIRGFSDSITVFQKVWYGDYPADQAMADGLKQQAELFVSSRNQHRDESRGEQ